MYYLWTDYLLFSCYAMITQKFLIPDGIEYYTDKEALLFEQTKSSVFKIFSKYKYKFVITPIIDSVNNLTNLNGDNLKSFTTSLNHKNDLGIRADITPQIVRLDFQSFKNNNPSKYSYMGDIYRDTPSSFDRNNPYQIGAEYFGIVKDSVDVELMKMCYEIISLSKRNRIIVELNDSYFIKKYLESLDISKKNKKDLIDYIGMKSKIDIDNLFRELKLPKRKYEELSDLMAIDGPIGLTNKIKKFSDKYSYDCNKSLKSLRNISSKIKNLKHIELCIDLCSSESMGYESGFNYSFYVESLGKPLAVGGRYEAYKHSDKTIRYATGFSIDLKDIITIYEK